MVKQFSRQWFDRFWQVVALLICLAVLGFELFKAAADLPAPSVSRRLSEYRNS